MKRILVTGAAGFIGSHTVEELLSRGNFVIGLDNFNPYYEVSRKRTNCQEIAQHPRAGRFEMVEGSILDTTLLQQLVREHQPDSIIHLAAMPGVGNSLATPAAYIEVNTTGTLNLLEAARQGKSPQFILASTSSVYGNSPKLPFREDDPADRPLAPYAATKRSAELLAHTYHHLYGINVTVLRFFTVYGPRNRPDMMAFKVMDSIVQGKEIPLYDGGRMFRDWTFVKDTVSGIVAASERPLGYEVINLGRGESILVLDFIRRLEELAGRKAHLITQPRKGFDATATQANISKARQLLGYQPTVSVYDGVERLWNWYQRAVLSSPQISAPQAFELPVALQHREMAKSLH